MSTKAMRSTTASTSVRTVICRGGREFSRSTSGVAGRLRFAGGFAPPGLLVGFGRARAAPGGVTRVGGRRLTPPSCRTSAAARGICRRACRGPKPGGGCAPRAIRRWKGNEQGLKPMNRLKLRPNALLERRELLNPAALLALQGCVTRLGVCAREGARTGVYRRGVEFIFDAQELVVLVHALAASRGTGFDLAGVHGNGEVSDRRVFSFPTAVGDHRGEARALGEADRIEGLAESTDLVDLHEQGVGGLLLDPAGEALGVGDEQVVTDDLHLVTDLGNEVGPAAPLVFTERVLDRN